MGLQKGTKIYRLTAKLAVLSMLLLLVSSAFGGPPAASELTNLVDNLAEQLDIAIQHVVLGRLAADLQDLRTQAHQALNVLVGRGGPGYDSRYGDPSDGVGLVSYARQLVQAVADRDQRYQLIGNNIIFFVNSTVEHVRKSTRIGKEDGARAELHRALAYLLAARGCPGNLPSEGGARTLQHLLGQ